MPGAFVASIPNGPSFYGKTKEEAQAALDYFIRKTTMELNLYSQFIKKGDLVFDVGANKGARAVFFKGLGAKVLAIEPQSKFAEELRNAFAKSPEVSILNIALGEAEGEAEIQLASADAVASLSKDWIETVKRSGRFKGIEWSGTEKVKVSTLDKLIAEHGTPSFVKIDVEGFELQVLKGLSRPVGALSFEFIAEDLERAKLCLARLEELGEIVANYSEGESMRLALGSSWVKPKELIEKISALDQSSLPWGDIYVKFAAP